MSFIKDRLVKGNLKGCHVVIGPPRSGTSVLSNVLSKGGIDFGNNLIQANIQNPKGFFENKDLQHNNNKLMRFMTQHGNYSDFGFFLARDNKERMKEIFLMNKVKFALAKLNKETKDKWGIKDPALCITFRRLYNYFEGFKPIYIVRDPVEVVISEVTGGGSSPIKAFNLWNECVLNILNYKIKFGGPLVLYNDLLNKNEKTLQKIKDYLGSDDNSIFDAIEGKYYRSKGSFPMPEYTRLLWEHVKSLD